MAMLDDGRQIYFSWFLHDDGHYTHALGGAGRRYAIATETMAGVQLATLVVFGARLTTAWHTLPAGDLQAITLTAMCVAMLSLVLVGGMTAIVQWRHPRRGRSTQPLRVARWPSIAFQAVWATAFAILALGLFALGQLDTSPDPIAVLVNAALAVLSLAFCVRIRSVWRASRDDGPIGREP